MDIRSGDERWPPNVLHLTSCSSARLPTSVWCCHAKQMVTAFCSSFRVFSLPGSLGSSSLISRLLGSSGDNLLASPQEQATLLHGHIISAQVVCFKRDKKVPFVTQVAFDETPPTPSPFADVAGRAFLCRHSEKRLDGGGAILAPAHSGTHVQRSSPLLGPSDVLLARRAPPSPFVRVADLPRPFHQTHQPLDAAPVGSTVESFPPGHRTPAIHLWIVSRRGRSSSSHVFWRCHETSSAVSSVGSSALTGSLTSAHPASVEKDGQLVACGSALTTVVRDVASSVIARTESSHFMARRGTSRTFCSQSALTRRGSSENPFH